MVSLVVTFSITAVASLFLTAAVRTVARRWGVVDYPDGKRKLHETLVPLWGGVAVYLAMILGLLAARYGSFGTGPMLDDLSLVSILVAGFVCVLGGIDDYHHLHPRLKLCLQVCSVLPMVALGHWVHRIVVFGYPLQLGWLGIPLTIFWLVGCINALNLLDGMDGLASSVGLSAALMMGIIAVTEGHPHVAVIAIVLAGSLAGFLIYNLPPATIFLGDSGSMVIGLVVGILGIQGTLKTSATLSIAAPAVVMTLPMLDTVLAVVRRKLTGRRFDAADRQHIHHRLLDRGLTPWQVLCILEALCLTTGAAATAASIYRNDTLAWITAVTLIALAIRLRLFGHYEFSLVKRAVARGLARLADRLLAFGGKRSFSAATYPAAPPFDAVWASLIDELKPWNVRQLELILSRQGVWSDRRDWTNPAANGGEECRWTVAVSFRKGDGRVCELRAAVADVSGLEFPYWRGLTKVLKAFAAQLADCPQPIARLALAGDDKAGSRWDPQCRKEAA